MVACGVSSTRASAPRIRHVMRFSTGTCPLLGATENKMGYVSCGARIPAIVSEVVANGRWDHKAGLVAVSSGGYRWRLVI